MSRGNRNMKAKFEKARGQSADHARALQTLEDMRPAHRANVAPILSVHVGTDAAKTTAAERAALVADYMLHHSIRKLPAAKPRAGKDYAASARATRLAFATAKR